MEGGDVGASDGGAGRILIRAGGVQIGGRQCVARVEPADRKAARAQQFGLEMLQVHPQIGALDEIDGQPGIGVHLAGDGVLFGVGNAATLGQGRGIGPGHKAAHFVHEGVKIGRLLARQRAVIPGGRGIAGEQHHVVLIIAGLAHAIVHDGGQQGDAVQRKPPFLQHPRHHA